MQRNARYYSPFEVKSSKNSNLAKLLSEMAGLLFSFINPLRYENLEGKQQRKCKGNVGYAIKLQGSNL